MRSDGDEMLIGIKNASKLIGISIISCCAVLICTMFLNFYLDIQSIKNELTSELSMIFYNAQVSTVKVVCLVSGGCLLITSVVMLMFYIKHYIDTHKKELGILKALGYSNLKIAKNFWVFGMSAFIGAVIGLGGAFLLMPRFYALQNEDNILPAILGGYRPVSYIGFAIGTIYQYALLRIMVDIVFKDVENVPAYQFDFPVMLISLVVFIIVYEVLMFAYSDKIRKISMKEIMIE